MINIHIFDVLIVTIYLVGCIILSLLKSKKILTIKEYSIGDGRFPTIVVVSTIFATYIDALTTIGQVEKIYTLGVLYLVPLLISPLFWVLMSIVYGRNIDQFHGCISVTDIMCKLYGPVASWVTNIASIIVTIGFVGVQSAALGYMCKYFFNIQPAYGVILGTIFIAVYSVFGGIRAVAWTDVFQLAIFLIAIPTACSFAYHSIGGYKVIINQLPSDLLSFDFSEERTMLFISFIFYALLPCTSGAYIQRFLLSSNHKQLVTSFNIITALSIPFVCVIGITALIVKVKAPDIDPNTAFIYFIANYMTIGIKGLVIAGILAATMSTADSFLNNASVLCAHDIIKSFLHLDERETILTARIATILISILAMLLALTSKHVLDMIWMVLNIWLTIIFAPLTFGFMKFRSNSKSFIASIVLGMLCTLTGAYIVGELATISILCGCIGSSIGLFSMHYWQSRRGNLGNLSV